MDAIARVIHIGGAVVWAGGALFVALFVTPAARSAGPGAAPFMAALTRGRLATVMTWASLLTVGSGFWLWVLVFDGAPPSTLEGVAITVGAVAGLAALAVALGRQLPTIRGMRAVLDEIGGNPPTDDQAGRMMALRSRMMTNGNVLAALVATAVVGMALG